ncbi:MAG: DUF983 domain-containing protein [Afipia sp.]|nr:DUF983 domain-containing protein [Afipia sp.]
MPDLIPGVPPLAALLGRCPRCAKGKLFNGFLKLNKTCSACGLDLAFADADDGAAVFIMLIVGGLVVGAALTVEIKYEPPFWVHAVIFLPLILVLSLGALRLLKGLTTGLQYRYLGNPDSRRGRGPLH